MPARPYIYKGRNKGYYDICDSKKCFEKSHKVAAGKRSWQKKEKHPRWIDDRSKLKLKRGNAEWKWFRDEVMKERSYTCEITGVVGGNMNVHHIKPVCLFPDLMYDKKNCVLIQESVHRSFHRKYGYKGSAKEWKQFVKDYGCDR